MATISTLRSPLIALAAVLAVCLGAPTAYGGDNDDHPKKHSRKDHDSHSKKHRDHDDHHHHHSKKESSFGLSIQIGYQTCGSCGARYSGHHDCPRRTTIVYETCSRCGARYYGHHTCRYRETVIYQTCGSCGARYSGHHDCPRLSINYFRTCTECGVRFDIRIGHSCHSHRVVEYTTCDDCGVRYVVGSYHSCSPRVRISYIRCGDCGLSYEYGHHHSCSSRRTIVYTTCGDCGLRYLVGSSHTCYRPGLSFSFSYLRCGDCGISYLSGVHHSCTSITYTRCGHCGLSYRLGYYHACPPVVHTTVIQQTPVIVPDGPRVVPSQSTVAPLEGWDKLRRDAFDEAIKQFNQEASGNPSSGVPHVGLSIGYAMKGDDAGAIAAMRKALAMDADALKYVPTDERTKAMLTHLAGVYRKQAESSTGRAKDTWFMVAAIEAARREFTAAKIAADTAANLDDQDPSLANLQKFIESSK